jgi:hypothetical protein
MPETVAVCLTGLERTLLSWPVVESHHEFLFKPHAAVGHVVETFIVLVQSSNRSLTLHHEESIRSAYQPTTLTLMAARRLSDLRAHGCSPTNRTYMDSLQSLTQWIGVQRCFRDVVRTEQARGVHFTWMYRSRTDVVLLAPTPLVGTVPRGSRLKMQHVYTPVSGMSASRCCPRADDSNRSSGTCAPNA